MQKKHSFWNSEIGEFSDIWHSFWRNLHFWRNEKYFGGKSLGA